MSYTAKWTPLRWEGHGVQSYNLKIILCGTSWWYQSKKKALKKFNGDGVGGEEKVPKPREPPIDFPSKFSLFFFETLMIKKFVVD